MTFPTRIYLTGFMGSGKSTLGPILANVLGYGFVDLDAAIEAHAGKPIRAIFKEEGEAAFRALEAAHLAEAARQERVVIALGGGALASEDNLQQVLTSGVVVYLRLTAEQLVQRLRRGRRKRPLLRDEQGQVLSEAALAEKIAGMLAHREPFYRRAHLTVEAGGRGVGPIVDAVVRALQQYGAP